LQKIIKKPGDIMFNELVRIIQFILNNFIHIWPYLLLTIPLAVFIRIKDRFGFLQSLINKKPLVSILIATIIGAVSPFCSCGVIPVIAALLLAGVPLAPVMSFWLASPSMDPEIFFLSVSTIGWELAVWRLVATFIMSIAGGYTVFLLQRKGWFKNGYLKENSNTKLYSITSLIKSVAIQLGKSFLKVYKEMSSQFYFDNAMRPVIIRNELLQNACCFAGVSSLSDDKYFRCCNDTITKNKSKEKSILKKQSEMMINLTKIDYSKTAPGSNVTSCCSQTKKDEKNISFLRNTDTARVNNNVCGCNNEKDTGIKSKITKETLNAVLMVAKFMSIAFFLEALIIFYIPSDLIISLIGNQNPLAIIIAALVGIPVYTSNLTALAMIGGLLQQGMAPGAALAFLISGPTTTIPAMAAVYKLAKPRVFMLYVLITLVSAIVMGYLYSFAG
jgi:uncharacterized protein